MPITKTKALEHITYTGDGPLTEYVLIARAVHLAAVEARKGYTSVSSIADPISEALDEALREYVGTPSQEQPRLLIGGGTRGSYDKYGEML